MVTAGDGETCVDAATDFTSPEGMAGVDNQFASLLAPELIQLIDPAAPDLGALLADQIVAGRLLILMQVEDDDAGQGGPGELDDIVRVSLYLGTLPEGATALAVDDAGLPAPGQDLDRGMTLGATVEGTVENGRLRIEAYTLPLSLAMGGADASLALTNVHIEGDITETAITHGVIGAQITVASLVELGEAVSPGAVTEEMIRAFAAPDLAPTADALVCDAISAGFTFAAVGAVNN